MEANNKPKVPRKGGGEVLRKLYEDHRKNWKPSPELIASIKRQKAAEDKEQRNTPKVKDVEESK